MTEFKNKLANMPLAWQGLALAFVTLPVWILFAAVGEFSRGEIAWLAIGVVAMIAMAYRDLSRKRWFRWMLVAFLFAHVPLVWFDPLKTRHFVGALIAPFVLLDYAVSYGLVTLGRKLFTRVTPA